MHFNEILSSKWLPSFVMQNVTVTEEIEYFVLTKKAMCDFIIQENSHILLWTSSKHNIVPKTVNIISIDASFKSYRHLNFESRQIGIP